MAMHQHSTFPEEFTCVVSANLKFVWEAGGDIHYSLETGASENPLSPYYFNMNQRHIATDLYKLQPHDEIKKRIEEDYELSFTSRDKSSFRKREDL